MKTLRLLALTLATLVLSVNGQDAGEEVGFESQLVDQDSILASFTKLKPMIDIIEADTSMTLYQGLPHPTWEAGRRQIELETKASVNRFGFPFYKAAKKVAQEDEKKLRQLIQDPESFVKFRGYKLCGGFHPDFALVWQTGDAQVEMHVCFGCHEVKVYSKDAEVYCDLPKKSYDALVELLSKYSPPQPK